MADDIYWKPDPEPKPDIIWKPPPPTIPEGTSHGATLDAIYNYARDWVRDPMGKAMEPILPEAEYYSSNEIKTDPNSSLFQRITTPKIFANDFIYRPYNELIRPLISPAGVAATGLEAGAGLYGRRQYNKAVNARAAAYQEPPPPEPPGPPRQIGGYTQPVDPVIDVESVRTYGGPRQVGAAPTRQRLALPAAGETSPTRTFYQGQAGVTHSGGQYPVDITEASRVPGWDTTPAGETTNLDPTVVAQRGQQFGQLAKSVPTNFREDVTTPLSQPETNYPIGVETVDQPPEQAVQPTESVVEQPAVTEQPARQVETAAHKTWSKMLDIEASNYAREHPNATAGEINTHAYEAAGPEPTKYEDAESVTPAKFEVRPQANGKFSVFDSTTDKVVLETADENNAKSTADILNRPKTEALTAAPEKPTGVQSVEPITQGRRIPATLTTGSVNLEEIQGERPFQTETQPIERPTTPKSIEGRILPSATKPVFRVGGEVNEAPTERPGVQPVGSVLNPETLTPEEAEAVRPSIEGEPVPEEGTPRPPFRRETVTAEEGAGAVRAARAPDLAKQAVVDEAAGVARVAERAAVAAEAAAKKDPTDTAKAEAAKLARTKANSAQDRAAKVAEAATKPVSNVTASSTPVIKPGQAAPGDDVRPITAEFGSPDRVLENHPETAPIAKGIKAAKVAKDYWVRTTLEKLNPFVKGLNEADRIAIGKILDTGETAGVSPDLVSRAQGIRAILDDIHQNVQDVPGGKPTVGYITNYFTHMEKGERPGVWQSTVNLFKSNKLAKTLGSGTGDLYNRGIGNPDSPYVKTRTGQLTKIDYDIRNVLPKYVDSMGEYKFDKPAVLEAKKVLASLPPDSVMKELASWYLTNYTRYDSAPQLHTAFENWASAVANRTARSWVDLNRGLHVLHLAELPYSVLPELGGAKYTGIGIKRVIANPVKTFTELARLGLLQGEAKPLGFRTAAEKWRSAAQFFSVAETLVKGTAYEGAKQMYLDKGYSPAEAAAEAVNLTKRATFVVDPSTQMKGLSPESSIGGGEIASKLGWQFKGAPVKIIENLITTTLEAKKNPAKATRMLTGTLAMMGTAAMGARTFHMNLADIAGTTLGGASGTVLFQIAKDVYSGDLVKLGIDLAAWGVPGGQQIKKFFTPSKPNNQSQNRPVGNSQLAQVMAGGPQPVSGIQADRKGGIQSQREDANYDTASVMDEDMVRERFKALNLREEATASLMKSPEEFDKDYRGETMPNVRPPSEFQKDPLVIDNPENAKKIFETIRKVAPQYMDKVRLISRAPTRATMDDMADSGLPIDTARGTNLRGETDLRKSPYEIYIAPDAPIFLKTLVHEMMHVAGSSHGEINPFMTKAYSQAKPVKSVTSR